MKNIIIALIVIIAIAVVGLWLINRNDAYTAEKVLYQANKSYDKILLNPDATPPSMIKDTIDALKLVVEKYPDTDAARLARMKLVEIYMTSSRYNDALPLFDEIVAAESAVSRERATRALYMKGLAYEKMGNWQMALKEFDRLRKEFPDSMIGMQVPLYIANHYRLKVETEKAQEAFDKALDLYNETYAANEGTTMGFISLSMILELYGKFRMYKEAAPALERMIEAYPVDATYAHVLPFIDRIYIKQLNDREGALAVYRTIYENTKEEKVKRFVHGKIAELQPN